jgi:hypothetical protein
MKEILFPYGKTKLAYTFGEELAGVLTTELEHYVPEAGSAGACKKAAWEGRNENCRHS